MKGKINTNFGNSILIIINKNYTYPGITNYLSDLNEFHPDEHLVERPIPIEHTRGYIDGETIPVQLPASYGLPKTEIAESNKRCGTCKFNNLGQCTLWNANIRNNFWCKSWQPK